MWRQVRGERGRERGREAFDDEMLVQRRVRRLRRVLVAAARRARGARLAARPRVPGPRRRGRRQRRGPAAAARSRGRGDGSLSVEDVPLVDELRYALGDVPERSTRTSRRRLDRRPGRRRPAGADHGRGPRVRAHRPGLDAADAPDRGRRLRPRARRRGAGPHADAVADGRPARPRRRRGPSSATRRSRRGRSRRSPRAARAEALEGKDAPRVPPVDQLPQLRGDLRVRRGVRRAGRARRRPARPPCGRPASSRPRSPGVADLEAATREAVRRDRRPGRRHGRRSSCRSPGGPRSTPGWPSWPELAADAPGARAAVDRRCAPSGEDRIVVLTGLDTKGLEFDGIVVVRPHEIEAESATGRATLYVVLTRATQLLITPRRLSAKTPTPAPPPHGSGHRLLVTTGRAPISPTPRRRGRAVPRPGGPRRLSPGPPGPAPVPPGCCAAALGSPDPKPPVPGVAPPLRSRRITQSRR